MAAPEETNPVDRAERSPVGRAILSVLLICVLFAMLIGNLPESHIRREVGDVTDRLMFALGVDQVWGVFAPDPRREVLDIDARISYSGGATETWNVPVYGDLIGGYRDYRWLKYMENAARPDERGLHDWLSGWLASERRAQGRQPVNITLLRRSYELAAPGKPQPEPKFAESQLYQRFADGTGETPGVGGGQAPGVGG
jgi:hypothetical protein